MANFTLIKKADDIPFLLSAKDLMAMGIARTMAYNIFNREDFPTIKIGNRKLVQKERFLQWLNEMVDNI